MPRFYTRKYKVDKPKDPAHPFFDEVEVYADYLELKKIMICKCGKKLQFYETEEIDGYDIWAVCPDEPGWEYRITDKGGLTMPGSEVIRTDGKHVIYRWQR